MATGRIIRYPDALKDEARPGSRLLMVSNRGPVEHVLDAQGRLQARPSDGGVATALSAIAARTEVDWIACAATPGDEALARKGERIRLGQGSRLRYAALPAEAYRLFYNTFCNPLLWFLQHGMCDRLEVPNPGLKALHAWQLGYLPVNQLIAERVSEALGGRGGRVMFHDYHFYLAPLYVRNYHPRASLQHFVHIPWPDPSEWARLPARIPESICRGLLANDSVVFQTQDSADNFLATCADLVADARVNFDEGLVVTRERETRIWANPISVDAADLHSRLLSDEARCAEEAIRRELAAQTIIRVDRLDPAKNIVAGFEAYEALLEQHPEHRGRVRFLAFLQPSRSSVKEYASYAERVMSAVERINSRFGNASWQPVRVFLEHNRVRALTALRFYDVLLVNSVADGMNLVSKEGAVLNELDGAIVLSRKAGSYGELGAAALAVDPDDVGETAAALHRGLTMSPLERGRRAECLRGAVLDNQLEDWLRRQLADLGVESDVGCSGVVARRAYPVNHSVGA